MKLWLIPLTFAALTAVIARPSEDSLESKIAKESQQVDHAFLMDCTGSMGSYIATAKNKILGLVQDLKTKYPDMRLRLAFIGYRDIDDWGSAEKQYIFVPFTADHGNFKNQIMSIEATGGGDAPEDVWIGLKAGVELDWQSNIRMMTLLSDAPHNEGEGRKKYADFKPIFEKLANTGNDRPFYFNFFKIGRRTGDLGKQIQSMIPENMKFVEKKLKVKIDWSYTRPAYARPSHVRPSYARPFHEERGFGMAEPSMAPSMMEVSTESVMAATELHSATTADTTGMESETSYMKDLSSIIGKAVDKLALDIKAEHEAEV